MSDGAFQLRVFSGRGLEIEAKVAEVAIPSEVGELGIRCDHRDYVGLLGTGIAQYTDISQTAPKRFLVSGGICTFNDNVLTLLADTVDFPETVNRTEVQADELALLEAQLGGLSIYDPEWELLSQRVARLQAIKEL